MATATYPPPPPFYRLYKDYAQDPQSAPEPPPPIEGTYICFGGSYTVRFFTLVISILLLLWS
jgi:mediator of RNA polymerase II transcription subunit 7